jgi:hypothetical protein
MQVLVEIPEAFAALKASDNIARELVEAYAAEGYRTERLSRRQVGALLGLDSWKTEEFLKSRGAVREFTITDLEFERASQR